MWKTAAHILTDSEALSSSRLKSVGKLMLIHIDLVKTSSEHLIVYI